MVIPFSFRYPKQESYAVRHINLKIDTGEKLAVIGELDYEYYQSLLAVVFQDYKLFSFSIKENLDFGKESDDKTIVNELTQVGLKSKLDSLSNGIYTNLHKNFEADGFEPSGGEG
ncbi:hypothetical protein D7V96_07340 [bacterium D16-59]|nr:hypothetical protein D7V96_07340 [bacterium D16-59]